MGKIGYLDLPCGLSGEMLLGCLVDCGWPVERLREVLEAFIGTRARWLFAAEEMVKGPLRAVAVDLMIDDGGSMETDAMVVAAKAGLRELGIQTLYASSGPAGVWSSFIVTEPTWDSAATAVLGE